MISIPLYRFRAALADVVKRAQHGQTVVLTRHGRPVAQVTPVGRSWYGVSAILPETRQRPRVRPFRGPGTMSEEIVRERRRDG